MKQISFTSGLRKQPFNISIEPGKLVKDLKIQIALTLGVPTKNLILLTQRILEDSEQVSSIDEQIRVNLRPSDRRKITTRMDNGEFNENYFEPIDDTDDLYELTALFLKSKGINQKFQLKNQDSTIIPLNRMIGDFYTKEEGGLAQIELIYEEYKFRVDILGKKEEIIVKCNNTLQQLKEKLKIEADNIKFVRNGQKKLTIDNRLIKDVFENLDAISIVQEAVNNAQVDQ